MADRYALEQVGVADGTLPVKPADGGLVHAKRRVITASFPTGTAQASGDRLYLGRLPIGSKVKAIRGITDTSLATATLSIGTTAAPTKYVNAKTLTTTDLPVDLGPKSANWAQAKLPAEEDLWLTLGVAGIGSAVIGGIDIEYTISA